MKTSTITIHEIHTRMIIKKSLLGIIPNKMLY